MGSEAEEQRLGNLPERSAQPTTEAAGNSTRPRPSSGRSRTISDWPVKMKRKGRSPHPPSPGRGPWGGGKNTLQGEQVSNSNPIAAALDTSVTPSLVLLPELNFGLEDNTTARCAQRTLFTYTGCWAQVKLVE